MRIPKGVRLLGLLAVAMALAGPLAAQDPMNEGPCKMDGTDCATGGGGSGTVTSVGNGTIGPLFGASWATATSTPAFSLNLAAQAANCVIAGPASGGNAVPTCRSLVAADIGFTLNQSTSGNAATATALAANPAACSAGQYVSDVAADGTLTCSAVTGTLSGLTATAIPYASSATALADSPLIRVDGNTIDQQNGTNAQTFRLYNTYSGAGANYERGGMMWVGNEFKMGTFAPAGTGAARYSYITGNGTDVAYWSASIWAFNANVTLPIVTIQQFAIFGDTPFAKPTCSVDYRGWVYTNHGASNVADTFEPCLKSADGTYAWQTMATGYGLVPTAPAGGGTCGTGTPALNADAQDAAGQLTVGGGSPTSCAITFGKTYAVAPSCTANGSATAGVLVATTTSTVTLSATALGAGEVLHYVCGGFR